MKQLTALHTTNIVIINNRIKVFTEQICTSLSSRIKYYRNVLKC